MTERISGDTVLHFADGTTAQHDAVLGCDGIKSRSRATVLGDDDAKTAVFSGKYAYRGLIPMEKAKEIMGDIDPGQSQMFVGYHGHLLTFPIANGTLLNGTTRLTIRKIMTNLDSVVAFSSRDTWDSPNWVVQTTRAEMVEDYRHWGQTVVEIMENLKNPDIWALFYHLPARIYYSNKPLVCLVGDAAHATTPHQGAGAGMCVEDAYILSQVLSQCESKADVQQAFCAYDAVRRPRSQKLVKTSKEAGMLWDLEGGGVGDDLSALERNAIERMSWIWDYDITHDMQRAAEMVKQ